MYLLEVLDTAKIVNDPVHGFVRLPAGRVLKVLSHPIVQRLRRISQLGLAHFVYPGATHTRFLHALGVMHLADEALSILSRKGVKLSKETWEAVLLAALLHDIGHSPFSHSLEKYILPLSHEEIGYACLSLLEDSVGTLTEVRSLWEGDHPLTFLCELIASQLDVDRLDYLVRDSFFTGVQEGLVGTERLIHTMTVVNNHLVVEEKGQNSAEKFIVTRRFMYWQVYLHKGVLGAEWLLQRWWRAMEVAAPPFFLESRKKLSEQGIPYFLRIDESTLWGWIHYGVESDFLPLRVLSRALLERIPYKLRPIVEQESYLERERWLNSLSPHLRPWWEWFWAEGWAESKAYEPSSGKDIYILTKGGDVKALVELSPWLPALNEPMRRFFAGGIPAAFLEWLSR
ncbi:MAG: HD domain-containing protein [Bacteroidia bacterium]|nr:HD domain-containing protein [Bacteroidia bacterium]MDW8134979.1 HD domain-containing protein [Bacteroidia bacterium]